MGEKQYLSLLKKLQTKNQVAMKIYASLVPVILFILIGVINVVDSDIHIKEFTTPDQMISPLRTECINENTTIKYLASLTDFSRFNLNNKSPLNFSTETKGGKCTDYEWDCNNPFGSCPPGGGAYLKKCTIVCAAGSYWVYCDGCGDEPCQQ